MAIICTTITYEMSETRAHFELKEWIFKWVPFCKLNQLRKGIGFKIWDRICAQN